MNWEKNNKRSNIYYILEFPQNTSTVYSGFIHCCYILPNNKQKTLKILKKIMTKKTDMKV